MEKYHIPCQYTYINYPGGLGGIISTLAGPGLSLSLSACQSSPRPRSPTARWSHRKACVDQSLRPSVRPAVDSYYISTLRRLTASALQLFCLSVKPILSQAPTCNVNVIYIYAKYTKVWHNKDRVKVICLTRHKTGHFGNALTSQSLGLY